MPQNENAIVIARPSFDAPAEAQWHRMISEAAYFLAQKRSFKSGSPLEDWLAAEELIKKQLSDRGSADLSK